MTYYFTMGFPSHDMHYLTLTIGFYFLKYMLAIMCFITSSYAYHFIVKLFVVFDAHRRLCIDTVCIYDVVKSNRWFVDCLLNKVFSNGTGRLITMNVCAIVFICTCCSDRYGGVCC